VPSTLTVKNSFLANIVRGSILNSSTRLEKLARASKWLIRKPKKLKPIQLVHGLLGALVRGKCSFRQLASSIGMHLDEKPGEDGASVDAYDTISKPALWERITPAAVEFLKLVFAEMLTDKKHSPGYTLPAIPTLSRIIVEDSALLKLDARHASAFPATKNQRGEGGGLRLQAAFDLITGEPLRLELTKYKRVDQAAAGDIIPLLRRGDLLLRDLGYFVIKAFTAIAAKGAHYLSRHRGECVLHHAGEGSGEFGRRIDLLKHLRAHAPHSGDITDIDVVIGSGQKGIPRLRSRLVARRVPQRVEEKRLRRLGEQERRLGKKFKKVHRKLQGWEIYITSLPREEASAGKIFELYPLRWRIEIIFKACKSYTAVEVIAAHKSNASHVQAMLYAWLCLLLLATQTKAFALAAQRAGELRPNYLSLLKVVPKVFELLANLLSANCAPVGEIMGRWARQIAYHDRYESRKKRTNMATMLEEAVGLRAPEISANTEIRPTNLIA